MALHGKTNENQKSDLTEAQSNAENLAKQLEEATAQIDGFKGMKTPEEVDKQIGDWKAKLDEATKAHKESVADLKFNHALESSLSKAKVRNAKAVNGLLNRDGLKFNEADGSIIGLDDQLTKLKESDAYLFDEADEGDPKFSKDIKNPKKTTDSDVAKQAAFAAAGIVTNNKE
jgi:hypothetical protein